MHALNLGIGWKRFVKIIQFSRKITVDHGKGLLIRSPSFLKNGTLAIGSFRCRKLVHLTTGIFTLAAANAPGQIHKTSIGIGWCF